MTQVKFNPRPFEKSFNNLLDGLFNDLPVIYKNDLAGWKGSVPVNIVENEKDYSIEVVAPGFEKADFRINVEENILTISAEKKEVSDKQPENSVKQKQIRKEYSFGSFKRSFTLDDKINASGIEAKYNNGVLTLNLPRKEEVKASVQQINIQ